MSYATRSDMVTRFTELQINELEGMHINGLDATDKALQDASEQMNSYLSARYHTPLSKTEHLTVICCDIARFRLFMHQPTDEVERRYKEALAWLKDVSTGKANVTFADELTADELANLPKPAVPIGTSHKGSVFGDDVFSQMPNFKS